MRLWGQIMGKAQLNGAMKKLAGADMDPIEKALFMSAYRIHRDAVNSIQKGGRSGRIYSRGRIKHQASAPGEAPKTDTGRLVQSIYVKIEETKHDVRSASVGTDLVYGRDLEFGTKNMKSRPWLYPAYERNKSANLDAIKAAIAKLIEDTAKKGSR